MFGNGLASNANGNFTGSKRINTRAGPVAKILDSKQTHQLPVTDCLAAGRALYSKCLPIWGAPYRETLGVQSPPPAEKASSYR